MATATLMADAASMRFAPTLAFPSPTSHASTSGSTSSSNAHAPSCCGIRAQTAPQLVRCTPASVSAPAVALSSFRSFVPIRNDFRIPRNATSRREVGASGCVPGVRCQSESGPEEKTPFGYTRKDVILIGAGLLVFGVGLKYGLELYGVDSIRAGNAVQLIMVLGLTVGWISTYIFRVSSKDMTYAKQLRDYEYKVMEKRLEEMPEAELESMLAQIEEEKRIIQENRDKLR